MGAPKGNKYTQKYDEDQAIELFIEMLEFSKTDGCLCVQDAFLHIDMPSSTFYHLVEKHDVLEYIKRDIMANISSRVNKKGLTGDFNATMSIWRLKQMGEKDSKEITQTNIDKTPPTAKEIAEAKKRIEEEI